MPKAKNNQPRDELIDLEETSPEEPVKEPEPKKKLSKKKRIIIFSSIGLVVLAGVGFAVWWFVFKTTSTSVQTTPIATNEAPAVDKPDALARFIKPTTGEVWLAEPKPIKKQGYTKEYEENTEYYEVGSRGDNTIIMSVSNLVNRYFQLFERTPEGKIFVIAHSDANNDYKGSVDEGYTDPAEEDGWTKKVKVNTTTHYDSLSLPSKIAINGTEYVGKPDFPTLGYYLLSDLEEDKTTTTTVIKTLGSSKLIKEERKHVDTGLTAINYALNTPIGTQIPLTYDPIEPTIRDYTWNNGVSAKGEISGIVRGCGNLYGAVARTDLLSDADFKVAGKTALGQPVYEFKDGDAKIVKVLYGEYKMSKEGIVDPTPADKPLSKQDFLKKHAIVVYKNSGGEWLIYTRDDFSLVGGCGKPVVYLYPTHEQSVDVRVGATVKISEPFYSPTNGWHNVTARPNGQLTYQGNSYDSLFWEGTGSGAYPAITSGTVVRQDQAASTIRSQLLQQGLSQKETADFMTYWESRIPSSAYVRLAWFSTAQLNTLAPLYISPRPDTVIRVFLDMQGIDEPIDLPASKFNPIPRQGFTVVEWGGLLNETL